MSAKSAVKPIDKMSDLEILEAAGDFGPGVIGKALYERAVQVRRTNPEGKYGPAVLAGSTPLASKSGAKGARLDEDEDIDTALDDLPDEDEELPPPKARAPKANAKKAKAGR